MIPSPYFILLPTCSPIALNAILPALPTIAQQLGIDSSRVQLNHSLYLVTLATGQCSVDMASGFLQLSFGAIFSQIVPLLIDLHPYAIAFAILGCTLLATVTHNNIRTMK